MPTVFLKKIENTSTIATVTTWEPTETQLSEDDIERHGFFNHLTIYNNSDQDCEVRFSGANVTDKGNEYLPAGSALVWDTTDGLQYTRFAIYNRGSLTIAVNKIICQVRKVT